MNALKEKFAHNYVSLGFFFLGFLLRQILLQNTMALRWENVAARTHNIARRSVSEYLDQEN